MSGAIAMAAPLPCARKSGNGGSGPQYRWLSILYACCPRRYPQHLWTSRSGAGYP